MAAGDIYRVVFQWDIFGYAVMNTFYFSSSAGWNTAQEVANEMANNFNDQWNQFHDGNQTLRKVAVTRVAPTFDQYVWVGNFPYFSGGQISAVDDPRLAATMIFRGPSPPRYRRKVVYYGALPTNQMADGYVSPGGVTNLEGLLVWLSTNYGNPGTTFLHHVVFSRKQQLANPTDVSQWFELVATWRVSRRIAHVHSRRTGAGI